ncbi:MAG: (2Fe-2S) ferredoxin domain-containing protein [Deltaproteobacteria bacterium]|nr:(2Fe-2S) ferredoxin domain-containing protein [Deltaproteobacteria bacterium]
MPRFDHHVFVCTNERAAEDPKGSCARKGSGALQQHLKERCHQLGLKGRVRINNAGCLDACALGPSVVVYGAADPPEGVWYTLRTIEEVDRVIDQHLVGGRVVEELRQPRPA